MRPKVAYPMQNFPLFQKMLKTQDFCPFTRVMRGGRGRAPMQKRSWLHSSACGTPYSEFSWDLKWPIRCRISHSFRKCWKPKMFFHLLELWEAEEDALQCRSGVEYIQVPAAHRIASFHETGKGLFDAEKNSLPEYAENPRGYFSNWSYDRSNFE